MYSKRNGFSLLDLLVKIVFAIIFILILIWLFNKKVPNMKPFYSNVFRENIKYMQDAGEAYFTDDKMPKEVGQEVKITLSEMFDKKLVLPFVDEDGNSCNQYNSYVSVKKLDEGYELKTNLVCNNQSDYLIKILGCHNYCKDAQCSKTCSIEKITQYQYRKLVSGSKTNYTCDSGYTLDGKYCYKTKLVDSKSAIHTTTETRTDTVPAKADITSATTTQLKTVVTTKKVSVDVIKNTKKEYVSAVTTQKKKYYKPVTVNEIKYTDKITNSSKSYTDAIKNTTPATTKQVPYTCTKYKTERQCTPYSYSQPYTCNCTSSVGPTGKTITSCSTCYSTVSGENCSDVQKPYSATCYKTENVPGSTTYSCPSGTDAQTGSGSSLKCYKINQGSVRYYCEDSSYKLSGKNCTKKITETVTKKYCDNGYKLEGDKCNKYDTDKVKATSHSSSSSYYTYKWSEETSLAGWEKTGKTQTVDGEEVCK